MRNLKTRKRLIAFALVTAMLGGGAVNTFAASNDAWTEATQTEAAKNGAWEQWCNEWENIKNDWTQMSLTPGKNETELNFGWYSKIGDAQLKIKIGQKADLSDAKELKVTTTSAVEGHESNKAIAKDLKPNSTYYYSYTKNGVWTEAISYKAQNPQQFSFIYVGDPQIGSSSGNAATGSEEEQGQDLATRNDSFNWSNTINSALAIRPNASFVLSAGDQIQTRDKKNKDPLYTGNEIEYAGYLSADALKSLPVATTVGNHDALSSNYTYHFNNPNASDLGFTHAGGDYYFSYGEALFINLNTNNLNVAEHQAFIEQAVKESSDTSWRIVTLHQDIYGSGEHSNEPEIVNLRYSLIPIFEANNIDVVLTGHDHTYSRTFLLEGGKLDQSTMITEDEFDAYFEGEVAIDDKYTNYLASVEDAKAVNVTNASGEVVDPQGILYMTANSSTGSKYYGLVEKQQAYVAARWQENVPTFSIVDITKDRFTIDTYRTDTMEKIDNTFSIVKTQASKKAIATDNKANNVSTVSGTVAETAAAGNEVIFVEKAEDEKLPQTGYRVSDLLLSLVSILGIGALGVIFVNKKKSVSK
ncbi:metallophosphoesterase [Niameybacter massiliensis]|uniref:Metallophosphoesterase n=1 Tax=Holtiella tumoricola TaxID=3018743 RepID=A0AA42DKW2_9FIRM|nr:metallophosphoesterase [Holtiella tumoricola]MDA3730911.1 metallophosphoesterase [Holtiella tumoricola]